MIEYRFLNPDKYARAVVLAGGEQDTDKVIEEYVKLGGLYMENNKLKNVIGSPNLANPLKSDEKAMSEKVIQVAEKGIKEDKISNPPRRAIAPKPKLKKDAKK